MSESHSHYMQKALDLARQNLGQTWPNPSVGAILINNGIIIGEGATARGGRPHAETIALAQAGDQARGATMYVSLEPCSHHGKTPPCVDAIIAACIARAVVACRDPHPEHSGGIETLRAAGIEVIEGVCEAQARQLNEGFFSVIEKKRPFVMLKIASSADGKIAGGKERWITGEAARQEVHRLRSEHDAVLTGIGTVLADDPLLNVRLPGLEHKSPVRVVLDRQGRMPADSQLVKTARDAPVWIITSSSRRKPGSIHQNGLEEMGVKILDPGFRRDDGISEILELLVEQGITRLMVEAGQGLNTAFLQSGLVDRVYWFKAPGTIGDTGLDAIKGKLTEALADWIKVNETEALGPDRLEIYERRGSRPSPG